MITPNFKMLKNGLEPHSLVSMVKNDVDDTLKHSYDVLDFYTNLIACNTNAEVDEFIRHTGDTTLRVANMTISSLNDVDTPSFLYIDTINEADYKQIIAYQLQDKSDAHVIYDSRIIPEDPSIDVSIDFDTPWMTYDGDFTSVTNLVNTARVAADECRIMDDLCTTVASGYEDLHARFTTISASYSSKLSGEPRAFYDQVTATLAQTPTATFQNVISIFKTIYQSLSGMAAVNDKVQTFSLNTTQFSVTGFAFSQAMGIAWQVGSAVISAALGWINPVLGVLSYGVGQAVNFISNSWQQAVDNSLALVDITADNSLFATPIQVDSFCKLPGIGTAAKNASFGSYFFDYVDDGFMVDYFTISVTTPFVTAFIFPLKLCEEYNSCDFSDRSQVLSTRERNEYGVEIYLDLSYPCYNNLPDPYMNLKYMWRNYYTPYYHTQSSSDSNLTPSVSKFHRYMYNWDGLSANRNNLPIISSREEMSQSGNLRQTDNATAMVLVENALIYVINVMCASYFGDNEQIYDLDDDEFYAVGVGTRDSALAHLKYLADIGFSSWSTIINDIIPAIRAQSLSAIKKWFYPFIESGLHEACRLRLPADVSFSFIQDGEYYLTSMTQVSTLPPARGKFFITPPAWSPYCLWNTILAIAGVLVAVGGLFVAKGVIKKKVRFSMIKRYRQIEQARSNFYNDDGEWVATKADIKAYYKMTKRYNRMANLFGFSTIDYIDGWQTGDVATSGVTDMAPLFTRVQEALYPDSETDPTSDSTSFNVIEKLIRG